MANANAGIHVTGIPELSRALRAVDRDLYRELRLGMKDIAKHVIGVAVGKGAPSAALRPRATAKGAGIAHPEGRAGSGSDPLGFYPWLDFGGGKEKGRGVTAGGQRREYLKEGRYVWPAAGESKEYIGTELGELIEKVAKGQRFEVRG